MRNLVAILLLFGCSLQTFGQISEVRRITKALCSPEFQGRGYVNRGDSIAASYLVQEFQKSGIQGYKKNYLQPYEIEAVNTFPGDMEVKQDGVVLIPGQHYLLDPSSSGFDGKLWPIYIEGADLFDEETLRNAISLLGKHGSTYNAVALQMSHLSADSLKQLQGLSEALAEYAPVIEIQNSKFTWSVGRAQFGFPVIYMQDSIYTGDNLEVHIDAELLTGYKTQNVMAYIPGKKKCGKTIIFTAHYDHLGRMGRDAYFPGGNDNASGTAMLLTMAKYFKENPTDYNILFVAFSGEEAGLLGSKYFVEHSPIKLNKIRFLINLDIMGSGEEGITAVNATLFPEEFELLEKINTEQNLLSAVKKRGPAANSDHYWFTEKGVPAFFIYTMGPNKNYHDVFDTYENLSFKEYEDITTLLVSFVKGL